MDEFLLELSAIFVSALRSDESKFKAPVALRLGTQPMVFIA
jgi:hypothetical protein